MKFLKLIKTITYSIQQSLFSPLAEGMQKSLSQLSQLSHVQK